MNDPLPLTDIHSHFVPGVDDGVPTLHEALRYLGDFVDHGITTVVTTPHLPSMEVSSLRRQAIEAGFGTLLEAAREALPDLTLECGFEIRLDDPGADFGDPGLCLGSSDRLLVEFPMLLLPAYPDRMLESVTDQGRVPVLAHPERYYGIERAYGWVEKWREAGAIMCLNVGSVWGEYGPEAERVARRMLALGHADVIASDHHGRPHRSATVRQAWDLLVECGHAEAARVLLADNPAAVLAGKPLSPAPHVSISDGWLGRLKRLVRGSVP